MAVFNIKRGLDIPLAGKPGSDLETAPSPPVIALKPSDFLGVKPRILVKEGDRVRCGTPLFCAKHLPDIVFVSPGAGTVQQIVRGFRRAVVEMVIELDQSEEWIVHDNWDTQQIRSAQAEVLIRSMMAGGVWPMLRQRPLGKIADPNRRPQAIYINGMDTEPLAADPDIIMTGRESEFRMGVEILKRLTDGAVYLTLKYGSNAIPAYQNLDGVIIHHFKGPHPAGLVGTQIRFIEPIKPGQVIWYLRAVDVVHIAEFFHTGRFPVQRVLAVSGSGLTDRKYLRTRLGVPVSTLVANRESDGVHRYISGSVLSGTTVQRNGFMGFYDTTCTVLPDEEKRELFGWGMPGLKKFSIFNTFASSLFPLREYEMDTRTNGGLRPIVNIGAWDRVFPLDIHLSYLIRAILAGDLEEAESLGLLELTEEDVSLCTFACASKIELGEIIRKGLDLYEAENT